VSDLVQVLVVDLRDAAQESRRYGPTVSPPA